MRGAAPRVFLIAVFSAAFLFAPLSINECEARTRVYVSVAFGGAVIAGGAYVAWSLGFFGRVAGGRAESGFARGLPHGGAGGPDPAGTEALEPYGYAHNPRMELPGDLEFHVPVLNVRF